MAVKDDPIRDVELHGLHASRGSSLSNSNPDDCEADCTEDRPLLQ